jgi:hypothetical protein
VLVTSAGLYFVWFPTHSTLIAELVGIGRGVDLILYTWVCISLIVLLNLHLKLRTQMELVTILARTIALADVRVRLTEKSEFPRVSDLAAVPHSGDKRPR